MAQSDRLVHLEVIVPLDIALLRQAHVLRALSWILVMALLALTTENARVMDYAIVKILSSKPMTEKIVRVLMVASSMLQQTAAMHLLPPQLYPQHLHQ